MLHATCSMRHDVVFSNSTLALEGYEVVLLGEGTNEGLEVPQLDIFRHFQFHQSKVKVHT
jgi:hypothetical protein